MKASLIQVAEALEAKLQALADASDFDVQVGRYRIIQPTPPCIDVYPGDPHTRLGMFTLDEAKGFGRDSETIWTVRARIGTADNDAGQDFLLRLMDTEDELSVQVALEDDQSLSGTAGSVEVEGPNGHTVYEDASQTGAFLGVAWKVTVIRAELTS